MITLSTFLKLDIIKSIQTSFLILLVLIKLIEINSSNDFKSQSVKDKNETINLNSCINCAKVNHRLAIKLKLDAIQKQILSKLKLKTEPNVTLNVSKELLREAIKRLSDKEVSSASKSTHEETLLAERDEINMAKNDIQFNDITASSEEYYGKLSEIIIFPEPGKKLNGHTLLDLKPPHSNVNKLKVTSAYLWIYLRLHSSLDKRARQHLQNRTLTLYIFRVKNTTATGLNLDFEKVVSKKVPTNKPGWKQIDLKDAIQKWFTNTISSDDKLTLLVDCSGCDSLVQIVLFSNTPESNTELNTGQLMKENLDQHKLGLRPFLIINTQSKAVERSKRHAFNCIHQQQQCCKQSLYVNFTELGWNEWIIQPTGYFANYCVGDCNSKSPTPDIFKHFHSQIVDQHRRQNPFASISPCCVPTRLSTITLLYFGIDNTIIKADLPKMVVEECGCV